MKTKYFISLIILSLIVVGSIILISKVFAQDAEANIQYPIKELGNCKNKADCKSYCDKPKNMKICIAFAEENNLMPKEEIKRAKNFIAAGAKGPGGCEGKEECETFCDDIAHIDECISFGEKNNLIPPEELEEAKKVQAAIAQGIKPPPCGSKKKCDAYCQELEHMEECIAFGEAAGFLKDNELEDAKKVFVAVKKGVKPPPCRGKEECDEYCGNPDNMEVCMNFAMEAGFMSEQEKADSQKMLTAFKKGIKPPACQSKDKCDIYCNQEEHFEECTNFAEAAGFMSPENAAMARKTKGKGPGDCKGKEQCEAFCNNPDNQETCFNFAKEHGLIPEEDLKKMDEGKQRFKEALDQAPPEVTECLDSLVGKEKMEKFRSGAVMPPKEIGDQMRTCFEKAMGPGGPGGPAGPGGMPSFENMSPELQQCIESILGEPVTMETKEEKESEIMEKIKPCFEKYGAPAGQQFAPGTEMPPGQIEGLGGCKGPEECKAYCESHPDECQKFQPGPGEINPAGQIMPQQAGPGGCKGPEECKAYCGSHPDECKDFDSGGEGQFAPGTGPSDCRTPEECQQIQRQMIPSETCQGENCIPGALPGQSEGFSLPGGQYPSQPQMSPESFQPPSGLQPPVENVAPPSSETTPPPSSVIITKLLSIPKLLLKTILSIFGR